MESTQVFLSPMEELEQLAESSADPVEILDGSDEIQHRLFEAGEIGKAEALGVIATRMYYEAQSQLAA